MTSHFTDKPKTRKYAEAIAAYVQSLGDVKVERKAQLSFGIKRKFLWLWTYEKTTDGTLYLTVTLDKKQENPGFHYVKQTSLNRWNHHVEVKSEEVAKSPWLHSIIREGYDFAGR